MLSEIYRNPNLLNDKRYISLMTQEVKRVLQGERLTESSYRKGAYQKGVPYDIAFTASLGYIATYSDVHGLSDE